MRYLLDVNALIALGFVEHQFHDRVAQWLTKAGLPDLLTCSITELGFVRILAQAPSYRHTVEQARTTLIQMKEARKPTISFIPDAHDISHLPVWVKAPKHTTDGHLIALADAHGASLATFDEKIPGAFLIP
jgi:predicted nucleic acid-binding protein